MTKKDKTEDSNRDDANRSPYAEFVKERRPRTRNVNVEKVERGPRPEGPAAPRRELHPRDEEHKPYDTPRPYSDRPREPRPYGDKPYGGRPAGPRSYGDRPAKPQGERRSYNPNFDNENRPVGHTKPSRPYGERGDKPRFGGEGRPSGYKPREGYKPRGEKGSGKPYGDKKLAPRYDKDNYPRFDAPKAAGPVRLNRFIAQSGVCSRREADEYIAKGEVMVNGAVVTELGAKVMPGDEVRYKDQVLQGEKKVYIVMNKPKGFVTTLEDPHADKVVSDLIKGQVNERVYPVGRLDKNSLGVLLITNDGDLTKRLTHPSYNKKKVYQVNLDRALSQADMEKIATGIELEDGPIAADAIDYVGTGRKEIGIEIHSGRNRIVRRIFESLGYGVVRLDRVYFAGLTKQRMKRGQWRFLSPKEVAMLKSGEYE